MQFQLVNYVRTLASFFMRIHLAACFLSTMTPPSVTHMFLQLCFGGHWTWTHLESHSVYWQLLAALDLKAVCLEHTVSIYGLVPTPTTYSESLSLQSSSGTPGLYVKWSVKSTVWFFFLLYSLCILTQSRGWGSAMGMVCRTSSSSCRARCKWISIQQGVSLMLCRG